jgi:hypothetical protein
VELDTEDQLRTCDEGLSVTIKPDCRKYSRHACLIEMQSIRVHGGGKLPDAAPECDRCVAVAAICASGAGRIFRSSEFLPGVLAQCPDGQRGRFQCRLFMQRLA